MQNVAPIIDQLNRTRASLLALAAEIQEKQWSEPPPGGGWSPGEIIAHLSMVETRVSSQSARIVQAPAIRVPAWKRIHVPVAFVQWRVIRVKTPIPLDAKLIGEKHSMLERFAGIRHQTVAHLQENHQLDLSDYRFPHPFFGSLNLYDWFRFLALHELRHTKQMQENVTSRHK
jgi:hypothetical protein